MLQLRGALMEAVFQAPKRRARVYEAYEAPLPVPIYEQDVTNPHHLVFKAELLNNHVIVRNPDYIQSLYSKVGQQNTGCVQSRAVLYFMRAIDLSGYVNTCENE